MAVVLGGERGGCSGRSFRCVVLAGRRGGCSGRSFRYTVHYTKEEELTLQGL